MNRIRNLGIILVLVVVLGVLIVQLPIAYSVELTASEKALSFLTDVVKIDVAKYNATASEITVSYPSDLGGLAKVEGGYTLESNGEKTHVTYTFIDNILDYFHVYPIKGVPLYSEPPSVDVLKWADAILQRYQVHTGFSDVEGMRSILSTINEVKNLETTVGNITLTIKTGTNNHTSFSWVYTYNGADYHTGIYLSFKDGSLYTFSDDRYNKIGSTDVDISREEAIGIAMKRVQNISWNVNASDSSVVKVGNVTILENRTKVGLLTSPEEPLMLYPYWQVGLTFDKVYPGSVYGVTYNIWADTGEIFYGHMHMLGGLIPTEESTDPTTPLTKQPNEPQIIVPTEPQTESPTSPTKPQPDNSADQTSLDLTPTLIAVPIMIAAILGATLYRRKKKNNH
jgi:hypothetical protein